jgi:hypothetical protein
LAKVNIKTLLTEEVYHLADSNTKIAWKKDGWTLAALVINPSSSTPMAPHDIPTSLACICLSVDSLALIVIAGRDARS